jgi:hypothetical protein
MMRTCPSNVLWCCRLGNNALWVVTKFNLSNYFSNYFFWGIAVYIQIKLRTVLNFFTKSRLIYRIQIERFEDKKFDNFGIYMIQFLRFSLSWHFKLIVWQPLNGKVLVGIIIMIFLIESCTRIFWCYFKAIVSCLLCWYGCQLAVLVPQEVKTLRHCCEVNIGIEARINVIANAYQANLFIIL